MVEQLATMAEKILEFSSRRSHFSLPAQTVAATDSKGDSSSSMAKLLAKIDTLTHRLESLKLKRRLPRFRKRSRSTSRTRESNASGYCWYHANFGDRACSRKSFVFLFGVLVNLTVRCPWCNGYRRRKWTQRYEFKS